MVVSSNGLKVRVTRQKSSTCHNLSSRFNAGVAVVVVGAVVVAVVVFIIVAASAAVDVG